MLALLLHVQAIRLFSPRFVEASASARAPFIVELQPLPRPAPAMPPIVNPAPAPVPTPDASTSSRAAALPPVAVATPTSAPATVPTPMPEPFYHSPHALTRPPELVEDAPAEIEMPASQEPGQLLLRLSIDRYGVVNGVSVLRSTLARDVEGQVVLQFYRASYRPGEIDGVPVNGELLLVVNLQ